MALPLIVEAGDDFGTGGADRNWDILLERIPFFECGQKKCQNREIRGFEVSHVHGLWHLDFHQAKIGILDTLGKWHRPVVLAILDDHSRLCCHLQLYLAETAQCLVHGFRAYGLALSRDAMRRAFGTAGRAGVDKNVRMVIFGHSGYDDMDFRYDTVDENDLIDAIDKAELFLGNSHYSTKKALKNREPK